MPDKKPAPLCSKKVQGPKIPGAQRRPVLGKARKLEPKPRSRRPKGTGPAKDEVDRSDRHVLGQAGVGGQQAHSQKVLRIAELKRLLDPISPSLLQVMSDIAHDRKVHPAVRLDAADRLLNRLYGKPTEKVEFSDETDEGSTDETRTLLNRILESVGAPLLEFDDTSRPAGAPAAEGEA